MTTKDQGKKKGFFKKLVEKIDKKMAEKASQSSCCGMDAKKESDSTKRTSCCG
ncbi:MAG: hypothetical protein HYS55_04360 [Candidatus Omnitrophica bacterium]|nr:hypothetical protein [Candidatus Omnitrophota bacterium]